MKHDDPPKKKRTGSLGWKFSKGKVRKSANLTKQLYLCVKYPLLFLLLAIIRKFSNNSSHNSSQKKKKKIKREPDACRICFDAEMIKYFDQ